MRRTKQNINYKNIKNKKEMTDEELINNDKEMMNHDEEYNKNTYEDAEIKNKTRKDSKNNTEMRKKYVTKNNNEEENNNKNNKKFQKKTEKEKCEIKKDRNEKLFLMIL